MPIGIIMNYKWFIPFTLLISLIGSLLALGDHNNNYKNKNLLNDGLFFTGNVMAFFFLTLCLN
jgi:hypothetical protein